jgi:hypothetical protein
MPLPPAPTQTADELNMPRNKKLDLNKPPAPQVVAKFTEEEVELEEVQT